ncbi:MAG: hypothetical protein KatS3mg109_0022 [Pirellulaceae bacterium]|nr:MAG: hypothetical protein KatS3mg109_0022 [Pirellulaceae bacterium]
MFVNYDDPGNLPGLSNADFSFDPVPTPESFDAQRAMRELASRTTVTAKELFGGDPTARAIGSTVASSLFAAASAPLSTSPAYHLARAAVPAASNMFAVASSMQIGFPSGGFGPTGGFAMPGDPNLMIPVPVPQMSPYSIMSVPAAALPPIPRYSGSNSNLFIPGYTSNPWINMGLSVAGGWLGAPILPSGGLSNPVDYHRRIDYTRTHGRVMGDTAAQTGALASEAASKFIAALSAAAGRRGGGLSGSAKERIASFLSSAIPMGAGFLTSSESGRAVLDLLAGGYSVANIGSVFAGLNGFMAPGMTGRYLGGGSAGADDLSAMSAGFSGYFLRPDYWANDVRAMTSFSQIDRLRAMTSLRGLSFGEAAPYINYMARSGQLGTASSVFELARDEDFVKELQRDTRLLDQMQQARDRSEQLQKELNRAESRGDTAEADRLREELDRVNREYMRAAESRSPQFARFLGERGLEGMRDIFASPSESYGEMAEVDPETGLPVGINERLNKVAGERMAAAFAEATPVIAALRDIFKEDGIAASAAELFEMFQQFDAKYGAQMSGERLAANLRIGTQIMRRVGGGFEQFLRLEQLGGTVAAQLGLSDVHASSAAVFSAIAMEGATQAGVFGFRNEFGAMNQQEFQAQMVENAVRGIPSETGRLLAAIMQMEEAGMLTGPNAAKYRRVASELAAGRPISDPEILRMLERGGVGAVIADLAASAGVSASAVSELMRNTPAVEAAAFENSGFAMAMADLQHEELSRRAQQNAAIGLTVTGSKFMSGVDIEQRGQLARFFTESYGDIVGEMAPEIASDKKMRRETVARRTLEMMKASDRPEVQAFLNQFRNARGELDEAAALQAIESMTALNENAQRQFLPGSPAQFYVSGGRAAREQRRQSQMVNEVQQQLSDLFTGTMDPSNAVKALTELMFSDFGGADIEGGDATKQALLDLFQDAAAAGGFAALPEEEMRTAFDHMREMVEQRRAMAMDPSADLSDEQRQYILDQSDIYEQAIERMVKDWEEGRRDSLGISPEMDAMARESANRIAEALKGVGIESIQFDHVTININGEPLLVGGSGRGDVDDRKIGKTKGED